MNSEINIKSHIKVCVKEEPFLGKGPIYLLQNIIKYGSIAKGAAAMDMSYRKAWQLVENMNRIAEKPLVIKRLGGRKGGGAVVTEEGKEAIRKYAQLQQDLTDFLNHKVVEIGFSSLVK